MPVRCVRRMEAPRSMPVSKILRPTSEGPEHRQPGRERERPRRFCLRQGRQYGYRKGAASRLRALPEPSFHRVVAASRRSELRRIESRAAAFAHPLPKLSPRSMRGKPPAPSALTLTRARGKLGTLSLKRLRNNDPHGSSNSRNARDRALQRTRRRCGIDRVTTGSR